MLERGIYAREGDCAQAQEGSLCSSSVLERGVYAREGISVCSSSVLERGVYAREGDLCSSSRGILIRLVIYFILYNSINNVIIEL